MCSSHTMSPLRLASTALRSVFVNAACRRPRPPVDRSSCLSSLYAYAFSHAPSWFNCLTDPTSEFCTLGTHMGAMHSAEIPFLFGKRDSVPFNAQELVLADTMQAAWVSFATTGAPRPSWPAWDARMSLGLKWNVGVGSPSVTRLFAGCAPLFVQPAGNATIPTVPALTASVMSSGGKAPRIAIGMQATHAPVITLLATLTLLLL